MPLETATYISDLNSANPAHGDQLNLDDSHARLIKATIKATFPNFTAVALAATQAQLDAGVAIDVAGAAVLADAGAHFKTNTTDGIYNPVAGEVDLKAGGVVALKAKSDGSIAPGTFYAGGTGQLVPLGGTLVWWDDTLPAEGGYCWANGGTVSRTTNPVLWARWGTRFGAGDGSTTFNVPDMREAAPVGKSTMGSTTTPSRITNYVATTIGGFIGACLHLLTTGEMPTHTHVNTLTDPGHAHTVVGTFSGINISGGGYPYLNNAGTIPTTNVTTGVTITNQAQGGGTTHDNVTPSVVCNWIIRLG